ncbi:MAG: DUF3450 family protein [Opitutales bacterium]
MERFHYIRSILVAFALAHAATASPEALEMARSSVKEWAATEKAISLEAAEWGGRKHLIEDLIAVADQRILRLEAQLEAGAERLSTADESRAELLDEQEAVASEAELIKGFLARMEAQMRAIRPQLPEPLMEELATVYQRLPGAGGENSLELAERIRTVVNLLSRIRQFDEKLTLSESLRNLPGSEELVSVRTLYLGLGQAYYLGPDSAGYGKPGPGGWSWYPKPEIREAVNEAMALAEGATMVPRFVDLPVQLDLPEGGAR